MTDKIRVLPPPEPYLDNNTVDEIQVRILEKMLEQAKAGALDGFVAAYTLRDGRFACEYALGIQLPVLIAAIAATHADMVDMLRANQTDLDQSDGPVDTPPKSE